MNSEAQDELYFRIGHYTASRCFVRTSPLSEPELEAIRRAAEGKWQERPVDWQEFVEWVNKGCPVPITGVLASSVPVDSAEEKAVEIADTIFEQERDKTTEWTIRGYDGTDLLVEERVSSRDLGPGGIHELLRRLACRHLTADEIIAASTGKIPHVDLSPTKGGWMTGGNPYYVAITANPAE